MTTDSTQRFSNRVANYVKYRPGYPEGVLVLFRDEMGLEPFSVVADIGSGTGISAKIFLENGNTVYGVEPNAAMRTAAEEYLRDFPRFISIDGTASATGLDQDSVDLVIAAQAYHWFDGAAARIEFDRILRPGGHIALMWNERQLGTTPFLIEYEAFLLKYAGDYEVVRHENTGEKELREFFGGDFHTRTFQNSQVLDLDGLKGRAASSSYMPAEDDEAYPSMVEELSHLFAKHEENGRIKVLYDTNVHYIQV